MTTTHAAPRASRSRTRGLARLAVAVACALTVAPLFAAAGAWLGWRGAPALPSDPAALQLLSAAIPGAQCAVTGRHEAPFDYEHPDEPLTWLVGNDDYNAGGVELLATGTTAAGLRAGLAAQGWHTADDPTIDGYAASRGRWALEFRAGDAGGVAIALGHAEPAPVTPLTVAGYALGLAAGALLARRARRAARSALTAGLLVLVPGTVLTTGDLLWALTLPADVTTPAAWGDYLFFGVRLLTTAGVLLLAAAVTLSLRPARPVPPAT
ncbi:hypothetical protein [Dactylosporangium matsuzakiense]|uniref:Uncharacterized protein n=1 Tax=Dactylosporangium matsuzakiense TaxID=53360 RepID=A0A9W6NMR4_9ACTN|nr:hypothetical protein [Dactylosporangium matsuzakiense]UWZ48127.1 hypothetical protein Dmats_18020 [Dactylosporangium matsuzakiense]GLL03145.1 hypothetical protein GCM10017581_048880 [Dactylosporangium matsuzakiense]